MPRPGRNDPCPCGSGKKYKRCCLAQERDPDRERELLAFRVPEEWLQEVFGPPPELPEMVDAATGEPILLVTDRTREVTDPEGREDVVGLLKLYEQAEERAARRDGRGPASFQFLWNAVGLDRSEELG